MEGMRATSIGSRSHRQPAWLAAIASVGIAAACTSYEASDAADPTTDDPSTNEPREGGSGGDKDTGTVVDGGIADGEASDAHVEPDGSEAGCSMSTSAPLMYAVADALLKDADSVGRYGAVSVCNMAQGRCVMRFQLTSDGAAAIKGGRVSRLILKLHRALTHDTACGQEKSCTTDAYRQPGTLFVAPLRNDWEESNARWGYRAGSGLGSQSWGAAGASAGGTDIGDLSGHVDVDAEDATATVVLDADTFRDAFVDTSKNPPELSLRTEFLQASTRKAFVAVMHENTGGVSPVQPPELSLSYCPSM